MRFGVAPKGEGSREVPEGRWSYHPDGHLIRHFPSGYSRTRVEIYVPEAFEVRRDALGRIVSIADVNRNQLVLMYDASISPLMMTDPGVRAYAIQEVAWTRYARSSEKVFRTEWRWNQRGWVLVGVPSELGQSRADVTIPDLIERYARAQKQCQQIESLDRLFSPRGKLSDVVDLGHLVQAIPQLIPSNQIKDPLSLVLRAWQTALCKRTGRCVENLSAGLWVGVRAVSSREWFSVAQRETELSGGVATPGNTSQQRLAISNRPTAGPDNCQDARNWLESDVEAHRRYRNPENQKGYAHDVDSKVSGGQLPPGFEFGVNSNCRYQTQERFGPEEEDVRNIQTYDDIIEFGKVVKARLNLSGPAINAIMLHEATHMIQCRENPTRYREGFDKTNPNAGKIFAELELEAYCRSAHSLYEYLQKNCGGVDIAMNDVINDCIDRGFWR